MPNIETPDGKIVEFPDTMSTQEINAVLDKQYAPSKPVDDPLVTKLAKAVDPVTKYALPIMGAVGGGALSLPLNIGAPGVAEAAGIGLGTLAGQQGANFIGQMAGRRGGFDAHELLTRELPEAGINAVAGPLIGKVLSPLEKLGKWLYGNAIKTPITDKWTKLFPGQEGTARTMAVNKGFDEGIYPTELGVKTASAREQVLRNQVNSIVDEGTASGDIVSRYDLIKKGLSKARSNARVADPEAENVLDALTKRVEAIGNPKEMTTRDLLDLKRQLYKEARPSYEGKALATGTEKQFNEIGKKDLAHEAMLQLEEKYPQLKYLNQEESAYIKLKEALEKTVARHEQKMYPGGNSIVMSLAHLPAAIVNETVNHPLVKVSLSQLLKQTARKGDRAIAPAIYGATANTREK